MLHFHVNVAQIGKVVITFFFFSRVKMMSQMVMVVRKLGYIYKVWEMMLMMIMSPMVMMITLMLMMV